MKLYVVVTEYNCYDCAGDQMYFQHVLGVCTSKESAKKCLDNAYEKLHNKRHPWTRWNIYEVNADSLDFESFDFEHRHDPIR